MEWGVVAAVDEWSELTTGEREELKRAHCRLRLRASWHRSEAGSAGDDYKGHEAAFGVLRSRSRTNPNYHDGGTFGEFWGACLALETVASNSHGNDVSHA